MHQPTIQQHFAQVFHGCIQRQRALPNNLARQSAGFQHPHKPRCVCRVITDGADGVMFHLRFKPLVDFILRNVIPIDDGQPAVERIFMVRYLFEVKLHFFAVVHAWQSQK